MSHFKDVPTDQLLSFQEFTPVHESSYSNAQLNVDLTKQNNFDNYSPNLEAESKPPTEFPEEKSNAKSFWSIEFYQQLFDIDTSDVVERIIGSIIPRTDSNVRNKIRLKPDLYGPLWISITLVFTIAISGNISNYIQYMSDKHWKYNFHLVSYAATAIYIYIGIIPIALWGLLKWSAEPSLSELEEDTSPQILELICIYGYSLFIYVPVSILWTIQVTLLQWFLVIIAALLSGSVLLLTLMASLKKSKYKFFLTIGVMLCHLLLASGFMLYFFHVPSAEA